jgi:hypothetical protein
LVSALQVGGNWEHNQSYNCDVLRVKSINGNR